MPRTIDPTKPKRPAIKADDPPYWAHEILSADEEHALAVRARAGDRAAWERLVLCNQKLVVAVARRHARPGIDLRDLVSAGNAGLIRALRTYDPRRGVRFTTYAHRGIRFAIRRDLEQTGGLIRIKSWVLELAGRYLRAAGAIRAATGREPDFAAACDALGVRPIHRDPLRAALDVLAAGVVALTPETPAPPPGGDLGGGEHAAAMVGRLLPRLSPRQAEVIRLDYGLGGGPPMSTRAIAAMRGRSEEIIRKTRERALRNLRRLAADNIGEAG